MARWILPIFLTFLSTPAGAVCAERETMVGQLEQTYEEAPIAQALTSDGKMVEVLASPDGATWTLLMSRPDGVTCTVAEGEFWQAIEHRLGIPNL